jgi:hypothetical protein
LHVQCLRRDAGTVAATPVVGGTPDAHAPRARAHRISAIQIVRQRPPVPSSSFGSATSFMQARIHDAGRPRLTRSSPSPARRQLSRRCQEGGLHGGHDVTHSSCARGIVEQVHLLHCEAREAHRKRETFQDRNKTCKSFQGLVPVLILKPLSIASLVLGATRHAKNEISTEGLPF